MDTTVDDISSHNVSLISSPTKHVYRNKIFLDLEKSNFDVIAELGQDKVDVGEGKSIKELQQELDSIYESKRYKVANRIGNMIGKIIRRREK